MSFLSRDQWTSRTLRVCTTVAVALAFAAAPQRTGDAYVFLSSKWSNRSVPYYVNASNLDIDQNAAILAVQAAAAAWTQQSSADFRFVYSGTTTGSSATYNGRNEVVFRNASSGSAIATTYSWSSGGQLVDTDIVFWDGAYRFFSGTGGCSSGFFVEDVGTHEFGHALGLGHSSVAAATMYYATSSCNQSLRVLDGDDVAGVEALYPSGSAQPPTAPTTLTAALDSTSPSTAAVLNWQDRASNESAYLVEQRQDTSGTWMQVAALPADSTSYRSTGLTPGQRYEFRVRASNVAGFSQYTNVASITTTSSEVGPSMPSAPKPANGATGVGVNADLRWRASGATSFDVYFGTSASPALYASNVTTASLPLPRLARRTTYYWKIVARNADGTTTGPTWSFRTR
ncbi:MAG: matrixin family metalloprotease [Vicinamibacterales bacterium]